MTAPELLPCPFCGATQPPHDDTSWIRCSECGAETGWRADGAGAIAAWNRRTTSPEVAALIAEARREERERMLCVLGEEYILKHVFEGSDERFGRVSAVRGVAVRMGLYVDLDRAIDAAIRALKEETP